MRAGLSPNFSARFDKVTLMNRPTAMANEKWFCVEDYTQAQRPMILLPVATLQECHDFIEKCREQRRPGNYRVNYSTSMRRYLRTTMSQAA